MQGAALPNNKYNNNECNTIPQLCYKLKGQIMENVVKEENGNIKCPICEEMVKNLLLHFKRKLNCGTQIDLEHFELTYQQFKTETTKMKKRIAKQQERKRKREHSQESYENLKEIQAEEKRRHRERKRNESQELHVKMKEIDAQDKRRRRERKRKESK